MTSAPRRLSIGAVSVLAVLAGSLTPAVGQVPAPEAAPAPAAAGGESARITLITGDVVDVAPVGGGKYAATVQPGAGRERMTFHTFEVDGELRVLPEDAAPYVAEGTIDGNLFDVQELIADGYGDASATQLPLIVTYGDPAAARTRAVTGARTVRELKSIGGAALAAGKAGLAGFWRETTSARSASALGTGITKIWLDGKVHPVLDRSVAQIGAPAAWEAGFDGTGVDVAVLDTGADAAHADLAGKIETAQNFTDSDSTADRHGHGTHTAATVAGTGAASGGLRKGVAPGADLLIGKVLNDKGIGYDSWIIAGMEWAAASGAEVVNMSLGGGPSDGTDPLSQAVNRITAESGTLFVISAGNDGADQSIGTPGAADAALTVGAVDREENLADFSSRGPRLGDHALKPDITAPGVGIVAARAAGTTMGTPVDAQYTAASGTSMAAPHVAGAAALVAQANPGLGAGQLKERLASTALTKAGLDVFAQGSGRVDVARATAQKVYGTGSVSLGRLEQPDAPATTKPITYTNSGTGPVTLDLTLDLTNLSTGGKVTDGAALGAAQVTVPAGGTASVDLTLDPAKLTRGKHSGWVRATGPDGAVVTSAVAASISGRHHTVHFKMKDRAGNPAGTPLIAMFGDAVDNNYLGFIRHSDRETGTTFYDVEEGTYLLHSILSDGGPLDEQRNLFSNPEFVVDKDLEIVLEASTAVPITIETPKPAETHTIQSYYVHRTHPNGHNTLAGVMDFSTVEQVNVTPTRKPAAGSYEFSSRWQLVAPMVQAEIPGVTAAMDINLLHQSPAYEGTKRFRFVAAGNGTPAELAAANVRGAAVLVTAAKGIGEMTQVKDAAAAGAAALIIVRDPSWGAWTVWRPVGTRLALPAMVVANDEGQPLVDRLRAGETTIDLTLTVASPYLYDIFHVERDRVPDKIVHKVTRENTAQVTSRYANAGGDGWAKEQRYGWRPWQTFSWNDQQRMVQTPLVREEWISANDSVWQQHVTAFYTWDNMNPVFGSAHLPQTYPPGRAASQTWNSPLIRPAAPVAAGSPVSTRQGDQLQLRVAEYVDSGGHFQSSVSWDKTSAKLWRDGALLADLPDARRTIDVEPAAAAYKLELNTDRSADKEWAWSTKTQTVWDFRSGRSAGTAPEALPMLQLDYDVATDLEGYATNRQFQAIGITVRKQQGAANPRGTTVQVEASFDDGATWQAVRVGGHGTTYRAILPTSGRSGAVSLRTTARDSSGSAVTQTVLKAYGLR